MGELEQSNLEKETNDYHNTFYQKVIHYKEKENAFMKKNYKYIVSCLCHKTKKTYD